MALRARCIDGLLCVSDDDGGIWHPDSNAFVVCRSDTGDGGWSLHTPDSTDEQIADGSSPVLASGQGDITGEDLQSAVIRMCECLPQCGEWHN